jgi:uncharacterized membrane protein YedE/YeeE
MTRPGKVIAFLDVAGDWDPSLSFVMLGAMGTYAGLYRLIRRRPTPLAAAAFAVPARREVDRRLVVGAAVFGVGWGTVGYCPGPAIVGLAAGAPATAAFVLAMLGGMALHELVVPLVTRSVRGSRHARVVPGAADAGATGRPARARKRKDGR